MDAPVEEIIDDDDEEEEDSISVRAEVELDGLYSLARELEIPESAVAYPVVVGPDQMDQIMKVGIAQGEESARRIVDREFVDQLLDEDYLKQTLFVMKEQPKNFIIGLVLPEPTETTVSTIRRAFANRADHLSSLVDYYKHVKSFIAEKVERDLAAEFILREIDAVLNVIPVVEPLEVYKDFLERLKADFKDQLEEVPAAASLTEQYSGDFSLIPQPGPLKEHSSGEASIPPPPGEGLVATDSGSTFISVVATPEKDKKHSPVTKKPKH